MEHSRLNLPKFNCLNIKIWLKLCDQAFQLHAVEGQLVRAHLILQYLPVSLQEVVHTALESTGNEYVKLKELLTDHFALHALDRMARFTSDKELGSRTAVQYLSEMRELLGETSNGEPSLALRAQFIQALPPESRAICVSSGKSLDEMAKMADEIKMATIPGLTAAVSTAATTPNSGNAPATVSTVVQNSAATHENKRQSDSGCNSKISEVRRDLQTHIGVLREEVRLLTRTVDKLTQPSDNKFYRPPMRETNRPPFGRRPSDWCEYHQRFGSAARNCRSPCAFNMRQGNGSRAAPQ